MGTEVVWARKGVWREEEKGSAKQNEPVKLTTVVVVAGAQSQEVLACLGCLIAMQLYFDIAVFGV